jgi:uncharacterized metal-binding protein
MPTAHNQSKPYPRPSGYLQAIREMEGDGEFEGMGN